MAQAKVNSVRISNTFRLHCLMEMYFEPGVLDTLVKKEVLRNSGPAMPASSAVMQGIVEIGRVNVY